MQLDIPGAIHSMFLSTDLILATPLAIHIAIGFCVMFMREESYLSTGNYRTQRRFTIRNCLQKHLLDLMTF